MHKKQIALITFFFGMTGISGAQIITDWDNAGGGVITTTQQNGLDGSEYAAQGIFNDWNEILREFKQDSKEEKAIDEELSLAEKNAVGFRKIKDRFGNILTVPTIPGEYGEDQFYLTNDGIELFLNLDMPAYFDQMDYDIIKWIRFYARSKRDRTAKLFKRFERKEAWLRQQFSAYGVPSEIAELCLVESGCTDNPVSSAGAVGLWQFMPETGRRMGLIINEATDERTNPIKSTYAAIKLLQGNYKKTGRWDSAVAAYNCGTGRISSAENKAGSKRWNDIKKYLPEETKNYIPSLIALRYCWVYKKELGIN